ncbi:MAG: DUF3857 domain-containing protein [Ignavibacteriaceae bacterium]|jgi:transglutaminase-like putative cysteine protease
MAKRKNKSRWIVFLVFLSPFFSSALTAASSDENIYDVNKINAELRTDADAVIRNKTIRFEVKGESSAIKKVKFAVTVFNRDGKHYGQLYLSYDKFSEIEDIEGKIYNADGNEVRELDDDEIKDYSAFSDYSLYEDNRVKATELYYDVFPYTVEYTYEVSYDGYLNWPSWYSRGSTDPVELSQFEVLFPADQKLRYWCNRDSSNLTITNEGDKKLYKWSENNLSKLSRDVYGDDIEDFAMIVKIAPSNFEIAGFKGSMLSWKEFGSWFGNLSKGKGLLSDEAKIEIKKTFDSTDNIKKKITKLYKYMQSRTRYVSVQLGIGSWQPFDATYVHQRGYGDCKALSNYMVAILKEAGITGYSVLINNGHDRLPLIQEFPSNQFNHVIVCVPLESDSLWLECTSQIIQAGTIGNSNENRYALMITPEGGVIVRTPSTTAIQNVEQKIINVALSAAESKIKVSIDWTGDQSDYVNPISVKSIPLEREEWVKDLFDVPDVVLNNYVFNNYTDTKINLTMELSLPRYASLSGKRIFFNPNLMSRRSSVPKDVEKRLSPIRYNYPYMDIDSVVYFIPKDYDVETIPGSININTSFGEFSSKTLVDADSKIVFVRKIKINDYSIPAEKYTEYRNFFTNVVKADRAQVILIKRN